MQKVIQKITFPMNGLLKLCFTQSVNRTIGICNKRRLDQSLTLTLIDILLNKYLVNVYKDNSCGNLCTTWCTTDSDSLKEPVCIIAEPAELHSIQFVQTRAAVQHAVTGLKLHNTLQSTSAQAEFTASWEGLAGSRLTAYHPAWDCRTGVANTASMQMCMKCLA